VVNWINPIFIAVASPRARAVLMSTSQLAYIGYIDIIAAVTALIL
jgi:hypothetical protein